MTYDYQTLDGKVVRQTWGSNTLDIIYDINGRPYALKYNHAYYLYVLNQQGDVIRIVDCNGNIYAEYQYDAWGNILSATGTLAEVNPIRYRGYYYDSETGFYYLQSRYYDPAIGRFINADGYASTGQGFIGFNMFVYCNNNPVMYSDPEGYRLNTNQFGPNAMVYDGGRYMGYIISDTEREKEAQRKQAHSKTNADEAVVLMSNDYAYYNGHLVIRHSIDGLTSWSVFGVIFLNCNVNKFSQEAQVRTLRHEYGHALQEEELGACYLVAVFLPSATYNLISRTDQELAENYYNMPWEYDADRRGGVSRGYADWAESLSNVYMGIWEVIR